MSKKKKSELIILGDYLGQIPRVLSFYETRNWRELRYKVLTWEGKKCACCGYDDPKGRYHVDHIKPRSKYPELELTISNLQVLCESCNVGKGARDETDWKLRDLEYYKEQ